MTLTIHLTPEMEAQLQQEAAQNGQNLPDYVEGLLRQRLETPAPAVSSLRWSDLRARASAPLLGEDAQTWVTRTRQEAEEHREKALRQRP
ncbi:MAG TPA: hypothetical protein VKU00_29885 [Chthonomonadaceae bacterium]|nr:hypothetical protein [Chthonomonadaceae bacterium]